jgi:threonyl-tRNA synthetase
MSIKKILNLNIVRHSLAHILAAAIREMYSNSQLGVGPAIENGFYHDFDVNHPNKKRMKTNEKRIVEEDLSKIEKKMKEIIKKNYLFKKITIPIDKALKDAKKQKLRYRTELINGLKKEGVEKVSFYQTGNFINLCKGPHLKSSGEINPDAFKLTKIAGAYWKGDEKNPMLTRIYGIAFETKKELDNYLSLQEEAEKRDHRILGQKLDLFLINENIGQGLPIWLPKGTVIRKIIENYLYDELSKIKYQWLYTPHIGSRKLWEISGHWDFYNESMYPVLEVGQSLEEAQRGEKAKIKEEYLLRPMNCPFHILVYGHKIRSYKELPIKFAELGTVYRYEKSGTLHGLIRVRGFTQDDAHLICAKKQIPQELEKLVKHGLEMLKSFGFKNYNIYLSTKPKKYAGSAAQWKNTTNALEKVLKNLNLKYKIDKGGGVFYGPKIDIKIKDYLNREWQCTTIQFDFNLPKRFEMTFINERGKKEEPYMIHRALLGSLERFFGVLLEHFAGALPFWLSPVQVAVINVGLDHKNYAEKILEQLKKNQIRSELKTEESVGKRIRESELQKIPYILVVGDKEMKNNSVCVRERGKSDIGEMKLDKFLNKIKIDISRKK